MKAKWNKAFDKYVCVGDSISCMMLGGWDVTATVHHDGDYSIDDDDCHNPDPTVTGCNAEQQAKLMAAREAYARGEWIYCGIVLSVRRRGVMVAEHASSLWGIEANYPGGDNGYLGEVADDLLGDAIATAEKARADMLAALK